MADTFVKQEYPKALFMRGGASRIAQNAAHHAELAKDGWLTADELDAPAEAPAPIDADEAKPKPRGRKAKAEEPSE